jgi:hypothetical protein
LSDILVIAQRVASELDHLAKRAIDEERAAIDACVIDHSSLPQNYWHERWRAEQLARTARRLVDALR